MDSHPPWLTCCELQSEAVTIGEASARMVSVQLQLPPGRQSVEPLLVVTPMPRHGASPDDAS